ncbi:argonaute/piwi family protein [Anaeromyxobacter sp. Red801]|uniref:argonaute/piwi family protein n=1 Tax=Anaeromyxobacter sp. Red801 TaxID=3411632 RepID=UPI003BA0FA16
MFADGRRDFDPKRGLIAYGPFGLNEPGRHPQTIDVGIVGTAATIDSTLAWLERCRSHIASETGVPFPGISDALRTDWATRSRWRFEVPVDELESLLGLEPRTRFQRAVSVFANAVRFLAELDPPPRLVFCALPAPVIEYCRVIGADAADGPRLTPNDRRVIRQAKRDELVGQASFLRSFYPDVFDHAGELAFRNFRRALKAATMSLRVPIQIIQARTWDDAAGGQAPDIRAWNFCVAAYYKAGGLPWSVDSLEPGTCYIGIDFFKRVTAAASALHASLAQVFDERGEGHVLRGGEFRWVSTPEHRTPHLPYAEAKGLVSAAIAQYSAHTDVAPVRVVIHKESSFLDEETRGFCDALHERGVRFRDLLTIRPGSVRLFREGKYPPVRGTMFRLGERDAYLYTTGYVSHVDAYDAGYIPSPLRFSEHQGDSGPERLAREVMALTRLDWNTANFATGKPVTLNFADRVGEILTEVPPDQVPEPAYRFYM